MKKVITYGSYDVFHRGHQRFLERAKELGDYLIVGVTSDDYDRTRGKINTVQSLAERIAAVEATGLADQIIVEEYDGQKIDDIQKYNVDVFTVGSDWEGVFDYLGKYCDVIYLDRTEGVSSTKLRSEKRFTRLGIVGSLQPFIQKVVRESQSVNGLKIVGIYLEAPVINDVEADELGTKLYDSYEKMLEEVDAVYIKSEYDKRYEYIKKALDNDKNVLCESPICLSRTECDELFELAKRKGLVLMEAMRTAYATAYKRLALLAQTEKIGKVVNIEVTCTNMQRNNQNKYASLYEWGPNAMLPIFQILGTDYRQKTIVTHQENVPEGDAFTKINFVYDAAVASIFVAEGAKSEGDLVISGTKGYIYVPAPWWKTEYFELRYEDATRNRRYFYQLEGDGISLEMVDFLQATQDGKDVPRIEKKITQAICGVMEDYGEYKGVINI